MPIFRSPKPSSCVQCHLASVDLKDYILPSHEDTFVSLRDQGLIDIASPSDSKILSLIRMGYDDRDEQAQRIHAKTRLAELEAFSAWIEACCADETLVGRPPLSSQTHAKPEKATEVIRHSRKDRVLDSFVRNVWSQRMRCFPCHTPNEIDRANPNHVKAGQRHREFVKKYGARMNLFQSTPEETMRSLVASSRKASTKALPLLNLQQPKESLFLLKPTSKVPPKNDAGEFEKPSSTTPVSHMGGLKMHVDDVSYKAVLAWIEDLARLKAHQYDSVSDLPADNWFPTQHVLRMKDLPEDWPAMARVQLMVHSRTEDRWSEKPIAFTQGIVTPRRFVNGSLMMMKSDDPDGQIDWLSDGTRLPQGKYLIKAYVDRSGRLAEEPTALLDEAALEGQIEISAEWKDGFKNAQVVSAAQIEK